MDYLSLNQIKASCKKYFFAGSSADVILIASVIFVLVFQWVHFKAMGFLFVDEVWNPLWLALIALSYRACKDSTLQNTGQAIRADGQPLTRLLCQVYMHLALFFSLVYGLLVCSRLTDGTMYSTLFLLYRYAGIFMAISLLLNGLYVIYFLFDGKRDAKHDHYYVLLPLNMSFVIISFIMIMLFVLKIVGDDSAGEIDYAIPIYIFLIADLALILFFLFRSRYHKNLFAIDQDRNHVFKLHRASAQISSLTPARDVYVKKLKRYMEESACYLNPNLAIQDVARHIGVPRYHLSQLINIEFGKNFFQFLADYRINYAKKRLLVNDRSFTLEALAYECGFNSKTSFNRYFKERNGGLTPSEYRMGFETRECFDN